MGKNSMNDAAGQNTNPFDNSLIWVTIYGVDEGMGEHWLLHHRQLMRYIMGSAATRRHQECLRLVASLTERESQYYKGALVYYMTRITRIVYVNMHNHQMSAFSKKNGHM